VKRVGEGLRGPTIADALSRPANGFALTRLALALAVVVSHAFSVTTGTIADEPLVRHTGFSLGEHAVNGFFAVSGFLVAMSFSRRGWRDYVLARALRIVPGFFIATLVVSFALGLAMTQLPPAEYLADPRLWRFVTGTLTTFKSNAALPEVFAQNPFVFPMGTVWTLKYEVICYVALLIFGIAGLLHRHAAAILVGLLAAGLLLFAWRLDPLPKGVETALRLPFIFAIGSGLYLWRDRIPVSLAGGAALLAGALLVQSTLPIECCSLRLKLTRSSPSASRHSWPAPPSSRRPICPMASISTAGPSSRLSATSSRQGRSQASFRRRWGSPLPSRPCPGG
jgi:peptidoglycan/LPS O-acetylase OafA/YrhL